MRARRGSASGRRGRTAARRFSWRRAPDRVGLCLSEHSETRQFAPGAAAIDALTAFGLFAVSAMLVCYALEDRSRWFVLLFAFACALGSAYGFLQGAWPFGAVEAVWCGIAFRRWRNRA